MSHLCNKWLQQLAISFLCVHASKWETGGGVDCDLWLPRYYCNADAYVIRIVRIDTILFLYFVQYYFRCRLPFSILLFRCRIQFLHSCERLLIVVEVFVVNVSTRNHTILHYSKFKLFYLLGWCAFDSCIWPAAVSYLNLGIMPAIKVVHTRLPSVVFRSWSRFFTVSLQVTWVINPAVGAITFRQACSYPRNP